MKYIPALFAVVLAAAFVLCAGCITTPSFDSNDPIVGTFYYSKNVPFLGNQGTTLYSLSYAFAPDGSGVQDWIATDGSRSESMKISWTNLGNGEYMVKIINPDGTIYGENLYLNGDELQSETDKKNDGKFVRGVKTTDYSKTNDPIIGTFLYSKQVKYLGEKGDALYHLYYVFELGGRGLQSWYAVNSSASKSFELSWTNLGNNRYMVKIINPDGAIYGENLCLDGDILRSESEAESPGEFVRVEKILQ